MKTIFLLFVTALTILPLTALPQSIVISPKKTIYTRKFIKIGEPKRNFLVIYPVINRKLLPATKARLEKTIDYWQIFDTSLKENLQEEAWLTNLYYKVNYNKNGVLDISLTQEGVGAYPDSQTKNLVIDLKTGKPVTFNNVFASSLRAKLAGLVDKRLLAEKTLIIKSIDADKENYTDAEGRESAKQRVNDLKFTPENFNEFSISDKGVTILYDAGFPHVIQALQPEGRYFFSWAEIKPFIKPGSLLKKFNR